MLIKGFVTSLLDPTGQVIGRSLEVMSAKGQIYTRLHQEGVVTMFVCDEPAEEPARRALSYFLKDSMYVATALIWDDETEDNRPFRVSIEDDRSVDKFVKRLNASVRNEKFTLGFKAGHSKVTISQVGITRERVPELENFWDQIKAFDNSYIATIKEKWGSSQFWPQMISTFAPGLLTPNCAAALLNKIDKLKQEHLVKLPSEVIR
jgi:hypothetical protein